MAWESGRANIGHQWEGSTRHIPKSCCKLQADLCLWIFSSVGLRLLQPPTGPITAHTRRKTLVLKLTCPIVDTHAPEDVPTMVGRM